MGALGSAAHALFGVVIAIIEDTESLTVAFELTKERELRN